MKPCRRGHERTMATTRPRTLVGGVKYRECKLCYPETRQAVSQRNAIAKGLCEWCRKPTLAGQRRCEEHQARQREILKRRRARLKGEGKCVNCARRRAKPERVLCAPCLKLGRAYNLRRMPKSMPILTDSASV